MEEIAAASPLVAKEPASRAYVTALGDFAIEITMLAWLADYTEDYVVSDDIYRQILVKFREAGIDITYPVMTVLPKVV
jgi:MscS family membrane protein